MSRIVLEIACDGLEDALVAAQGGADRLELCSALALDGLTPSFGLVLELREALHLPLMAMVRPRAGDATYSSAELTVMHRDAQLLLDAGVDGIVFGVLDARGRVDAHATREFVGLAADREAVFHRAFDHVPDPEDALEALIEAGVRRVLTSGGAPTALEGVDRIRALVERAAGRIEILPAGGIREANVRSVLERTGCTQVHLSRR
jgi:copper homeostasis protein